MKHLRRIDGLPKGLLDTGPRQLLDALGAPSLLRLRAPQAAAPPLLISLLLHGNEVSGWNGLRRVLRTRPAPPFDLLIFIGNVEAAAAGVRTLPGQTDFNRIWRPPTGIAAELLQALEAAPPQAVVDLHNNTGKNPHYAVLTDLSPSSLGLARLFSEVGVIIEEPDSVLTRAFTDRNIPGVTLELGSVGDPKAEERAANFCSALFDQGLPASGSLEDLQLFRTLARVHAPADATFTFMDNPAPWSPLRTYRREDAPPRGQRRWLTPPVSEGAAAAKALDRGAFAGGAGEPAQGRRRETPHEVGHQAGDALGQEPDMLLDSALEANNFRPLPPGASFGIARNGAGLKVLDNRHQDVTERFLRNHEGRIVAAQTLIPAMYTTDAAVVRQDCLCYLMAPAHDVGAAVGL